MSALPLASVLVASLVGSVHCGAMCGGFVAAYAGGDERGAGRRAAAHLAYNGGRLVTYLALGAVAGAVGQALDLAGRAVGVAHAAAFVTGAFLVATGLVALAPRRRLLALGTRPSRGLGTALGALLARFRRAPATVRAGVLGLSSTLLPCGWLYAFAAFAAATGSAWAGARLMGVFWLGTVPMLVGLGISLETFARKFAGIFSRLRPALVIGVGAVTLVSRLGLPAFAATRPAASTTATAVPSAADCPCHHHP
jgi:sulfite exporter TauE/SafE